VRGKEGGLREGGGREGWEEGGLREGRGSEGGRRED
jgi:hypothetical protein